MPPASVDVAIVGAGPYGLALATHLRARGIEHRIFGRPMHAWRSMPAGMYLKSLGFATTIPTPHGHPTLPEYCLAQGLEDYDPIAIQTFARYGVSLQQELVPYAEDRNVRKLERVADQFVVTLDDDEQVRARRVVLAIGLSYFERMPEFLSDVPSELASHTAHHREFASFRGSKVAVIGGGQSALQTAALLHKEGADVQLLVRKSVVWGGKAPRYRSLIERVRAPGTVIGWGKGKWIIEHVPMLLHYLPENRRLNYNQKKLGPSGAWWLRQEVESNIPMATNTSVTAAIPEQGRLHLYLDESGLRQRDLIVDHVIAGTGYTVDVDRIGFLASDLAQQIRRIGQAPRLSRYFESSVPNLYFVGPASVASFGPLFRFVAGSVYTVPHVARHLGRPSTTAPLTRPVLTRVSDPAPAPVA